MKILIICAGDRSKNFIALNAIKNIDKTKLDDLTVCVLDKNKYILNFLKKRKINFVTKNISKFFEEISKNQFDWLLNIWGYKILKQEFLKKFEFNLNLHPSYLPYNRGRDPYYFSVINNTPVGVCIHRMDKTIDGGKYYLRKKINIKFPMTAGEIFNKSLKEIKFLFIKNWIKIRCKKIKLKKFNQKNKSVNKRKTLIEKNFLDLDNKKNKKEKSFLLNCLAQDFDFLKQQVKLNGKIYNCKINLKSAKKKKW